MTPDKGRASRQTPRLGPKLRHGETRSDETAQAQCLSFFFVRARNDGEASELNLRRLFGAFGGGALGQRLVARKRGFRPEHGWESAQRGIVSAHRLDVVAPRYRDAVLGAFKLRLQCQEVGVGFEVRIIFGYRKQ